MNQKESVQLCTMHQAADYIHVSYQTFLRVVKKGVIPYYNPSGTRSKKFKYADLDAYLNSVCVNSSLGKIQNT